MTEEKKKEELEGMGPRVEMAIPEFADDDGDWLSFSAIAASLWTRMVKGYPYTVCVNGRPPPRP